MADSAPYLRLHLSLLYHPAGIHRKIDVSPELALGKLHRWIQEEMGWDGSPTAYFRGDDVTYPMTDSAAPLSLEDTMEPLQALERPLEYVYPRDALWTFRITVEGERERRTDKELHRGSSSGSAPSGSELSEVMSGLSELVVSTLRSTMEELAERDGRPETLRAVSEAQALFEDGLTASETMSLMLQSRTRQSTEELLFVLHDNLARRYYDEPSALHLQGYQFLQDLLLVDPPVLDEERRARFQTALLSNTIQDFLGASAKELEPDRQPPRPGRNEPCWCGSGRKYKRCHLRSDRG